jgi:lipopolysaccharide/colanic/teichoic acid biosynthesis glycosyltransferase
LSTVDLEPIRNSLVDGLVVRRHAPVAELAERTAGFLLLAAAGPVIAMSALAVAGLSERSPFVAHLRVGRNGKPFWTWKIRTMWEGTKANPGRPRWVEYIMSDPLEDDKVRLDPRVTSRFAAFCRRHSIDELPQLWHVLRGEMSLVGPRPLTRSELDKYYRDDVSELLSVKPGLTGLWQVYGRSAIKFPERARLDLKLVRTLKPKLYVKVLLRTIPAVIRGNGAW